MTTKKDTNCQEEENTLGNGEINHFSSQWKSNNGSRIKEGPQEEKRVGYQWMGELIHRGRL
jgi:hypothetical protein